MCRLVIIECGLKQRRIKNGYVKRTESHQFLDFWTLEDGADRLSRNLGME